MCLAACARLYWVSERTSSTACEERIAFTRSLRKHHESVTLNWYDKNINQTPILVKNFNAKKGETL
jgi:hypothetical protein